MCNEADIIINGNILSYAQSMTVRVALENFSLDINGIDYLGSDETGKSIKENYVERMKEIRQYLYK